MLCMLLPLISYSLAPSSIMMSCTVHSPMDSFVQPSCILVYILCNPAPRGSPFELSLGLRSKLPSPTLSPSSQSSCVCWFLVLWPWVASLELESKPSTCPSHTCSPSLIRKLYLDSRVKELLLCTFCFEHGQPLVPFPVAHLGLGNCTYLAPYLYVLYTSPGSCLVSEDQCPFKSSSNPQGD